MRLQCLCQLFACLLLVATAHAADPDTEKTPLHNYPTVARLEYVNACMAKGSDKLAVMYQCACAIDRIADAMSYEDFVEASTYAKYATLPGEGGGVFRDSDRARQLAKRYRDLENASLMACGMRV